jgi:hypothetical protein
MNVGHWILIIMFFIFLIFILLGFYIYHKNKNNTSIYANPEVWGQPFPSTDNTRNVCSLYQFVPAMTGGYLLVPSPTLNTNILDSLEPLPSGNCVDVDQINAEQVIHTCIIPAGITISNPIVLCTKQDGEKASLEESETFYIGCNTQAPQCSGELVCLALGFEYQSVNYCMVNNGENNLITMSYADMSQPSQIFRLTKGIPILSYLTYSISDRTNTYFLTASDTILEFAFDLGSSTFTTDAPGLTMATAANMPNNNTNVWIIVPFPSIGTILLYTGNLNLSSIPQNPQQLTNWLVQNGALCAAFGNTSPSNLVLLLFSTLLINPSISLAYSFNYSTFSDFNTVMLEG